MEKIISYNKRKGKKIQGLCFVLTAAVVFCVFRFMQYTLGVIPTTFLGYCYQSYFVQRPFYGRVCVYSSHIIYTSPGIVMYQNVEENT
jgi:hypothetical protein